MEWRAVDKPLPGDRRVASLCRLPRDHWSSQCHLAVRTRMIPACDSMWDHRARMNEWRCLCIAWPSGFPVGRRGATQRIGTNRIEWTRRDETARQQKVAAVEVTAAAQ